MKIAIWKTGHQIADTVADAFGSYGEIDYINNADKLIMGDARNRAYKASEVPQVLAELFNQYGTNLCYGILRGASTVFTSNSWFNIDRGYFNPGHFDGYYRISYKGTQAKWHDDIPQADIDFELEPWRNKDGYILICPPSEPVIDFFGLKRRAGLLETEWEIEATRLVMQMGLPAIRRAKTASNEIDWNNVKGVITFNSSIGWQALQRGIPCISDKEHSIVGSYYTEMLCKKGLDYNLDNVMKAERESLFRAMQAHQFTLAEIREGKAWSLLNHYLKKS